MAGSFAALAGAFSVAVGDVNRDGKQDLVVANAFAGVNKVSVLLGNGIGVATVRGCIVSITHTKQQRRVSFSADLSARRGTATVIIANQTTCQIIDQNMANNNCQCPLPPSGAKR